MAKRNVEFGYTVGKGKGRTVHPIRASKDYDPRRAGERNPGGAASGAGAGGAGGGAGAGSQGGSSRTEVRSPTSTSTSTEAETTGNITVTGGAGAGANTTVKILRGNPAAAALEGYERFHGHASHELLAVTSKAHYHSHLWAMGKLEYLIVAGVDGYKHEISGFGGSLLCSNEAPDELREKNLLGNQMFVEGGDQAVDLAVFGIAPEDAHEVETLGQITEIGYKTQKDHLGDQGGKALYFHVTGEEGKVRKVKGVEVYDGGWPPDLIYRVRDKRLEISGGSYTITPEGIVN